MDEELINSIITMNGMLRIDLINGLVTFHDGWDRVILRVSHLPEPIPDNMLIDIVALRNLTGYTPLKGKALGKNSYEDIVHSKDESCPVCFKVHFATDYFMWGEYSFVKGHEYIIWTRNGMQTYAHRGRMQFLGPSAPRYRLQFNARGPDRSHKGQYGGTQTLDARNIVKLEEVDIDPKKRYVDEIDRDMKRIKQ